MLETVVDYAFLLPYQNDAMMKLQRPQINWRYLLISFALVLAGLYLLDFLDNHLQTAKENLLETQTQVVRLESMLKNPQNWNQYREKNVQAALSLEERFIDSTTHDLAQADVQSLLQGLLAEQAGIQRPMIDVDVRQKTKMLSGGTKPQSYWELEATIRAQSNIRSTLNVLRSIEGDKNWSVNIQNAIIEKNRFLFNLSLIALKSSD